MNIFKMFKASRLHRRFKSTYRLMDWKSTKLNRDVIIANSSFSIINVVNSKAITLHLRSKSSRIQFNFPENYPKFLAVGKADHSFFTSSMWHNYAGLIAVHPDMSKLKVYAPKHISAFIQKYIHPDLIHDMEAKIDLYPCLTVKTILYHENKSDCHNWAAAYVVTVTSANTCSKPSYGLHNLFENSKEWFTESEIKELSTSHKNAKSLVNEENGHFSDQSEEKTTFIVMEVPSVEYLDSVLQQADFNDYYCKEECTSLQPKLIIHFTPEHIMHNLKYQKFLSRFSNTCRHLFICGTKSYGYEKFLNNLTMRKIFCPFVQDLSIEDSYKDRSHSHRSIDNSNIINVDSEFTVWQEGTDLKYCRMYAELKSRESIKDIMSMDQISKQTFDELKIEHENTALERNANKRPYPNITFFGTGGTDFREARGQSAILVELSEDKIVLLDCGLGTWHQMNLLYGCEKTKEILKKIRFIFCSHCHWDHYSGLYTLLIERKKAFENSTTQIPGLVLMSTPAVIRYLKLFQTNVDNLLNQNIKIFSLPLTGIGAYETDYGLRIKTVEVEHICKAFGIAFMYDFVKIVYSGDTKPCDKLVQIGKNCDILIHEATHSCGKEERSLQTCHSTVSQAIDVGQRMNAKEIYLTHFGLHYSIFPITLKQLPENVAYAFDFLKVHLNDTQYLETVAPSFEKIFYDEFAVLRHNAAQKNSDNDENNEIKL